MAKCIRCGRPGMGVLHQAIKLKDKNMVCFKCFKELGRNPLKEMTTAPLSLTWDDIKNGPESVEDKIERKAAQYDQEQNEAAGFRFAHYGEQRDLNATDGEMEMYETVCELLEDDGCDPEPLELVRKSDSYVSVVLGETDVARMKYTDRVKWILLPYVQKDKIRIGSAKDLNKYASDIVKSYRIAEDINSKA